MNDLALCSGSGLLELGVQLAAPSTRTVCYVENGAYASSCLVHNMDRGWLCEAPVWDDVGTFDGRSWRGVVDLITAGYPCQPFSQAGSGRGVEDPRHLWPEILRIVDEVEPSLCFFENVRGHVRNGLSVVWSDLRALGFEVHAGLFSAAEVGAPHRRERLFILASHPDRERLQERPEGCARQADRTISECSDRSSTSNADGRRFGEIGEPQGDSPGRGNMPRRLEPDRYGGENYWRRVPAPESVLCRMDDGMAHWPDRLLCTGNGVVPQQAALAWTTLRNQL